MFRNRRINNLNMISLSGAEEQGQGKGRITGLGVRAKRRRTGKVGLETEKK